MMATDADVVRCSSPWPGLAAQLLGAIAGLGNGNWTLERLSAANSTRLEPGDVQQVLQGLEIAGVCVRQEGGEEWCTSVNKAELERLAALLRGAEYFRRLRLDAKNLELVVTMPMAPSRLAEELPGSPGRPGDYLPTANALLRIAAAAEDRLLVMMPFIDSRGFLWLKQVFEGARASTQKILILRNVEEYVVELSVHHADWLREMKVAIWDYHVAHDRGRALPLETFHAKIVLADSGLAYVGSANILGSGEGTSLEAGVLVDGRAAGQVSRLVDGVLRVARRV